MDQLEDIHSGPLKYIYASVLRYFLLHKLSMLFPFKTDLCSNTFYEFKLVFYIWPLG